MEIFYHEQGKDDVSSVRLKSDPVSLAHFEQKEKDFKKSRRNDTNYNLVSFAIVLRTAGVYTGRSLRRVGMKGKEKLTGGKEYQLVRLI